MYHGELGGLGEYSLQNLMMTHLFAFPVNTMVYNTDANTLYSLGSNEIYSYVLGAASYETRVFSWSPYEANDFTGKHLRGDGGKLVMSWRGAEADGIGIYTLDTDTSEIRQVR